MNEIKCYFEPTDSYAKIEIMEHIESTSNKRPIEINSINELTHVKDGQKIILFLSKISHTARCLCNYRHLNIVVIDIIDDMSTPCSISRRTINIRQPIEAIFNTLDNIIDKHSNTFSCECCNILFGLSPIEKKLIQMLRSGEQRTEALASKMGVNSKTVSRHKRSIMSKINIDNSISFYKWVERLDNHRNIEVNYIASRHFQ